MKASQSVARKEISYDEMFIKSSKLIARAILNYLLLIHNFMHYFSLNFEVHSFSTELNKKF